MLYHPTKEKVGQSVENAVIKGVVQQLQDGKKPETAVVEYVLTEPQSIRHIRF